MRVRLMDALHAQRRLWIACVLWLAAGAAASAQEVTAVPPGDASLAGRVFDRDSQKPLAGATVTLRASDFRDVAKTTTDANGAFRFEGIAPATYYVTTFLDGYGSQDYGRPDEDDGRAQVVSVSPGQAIRGLDVGVRRAGVIAGVVTTTDGRPVKDATVSLTLTFDDRTLVLKGTSQARTDATGAYVIRNVPAGRYRVAAVWLDPERLKAGARGEYRPSYFPGTESPAEAVVIRVGSGETVRGINFPIFVRELLRVSGHVLRGNSEGAIEAVLLAPRWSVRTIRVAEDGAFEITHLEPGHYTFWARARAFEGYEAAVVTLDLGSDMNGLSVALLPTGRVSGRVVTGDGTMPPGGLQVSAVQADEGKQIDPLDRDRVDVTEDGRFELRGLFGERILRVLGLGPEWEVDRVLRGKSAVPSLKIVSGEQIDDITIVVKRR